MSWSEITTVDALTELVGEPNVRARNKVRTALHDLDRQWLAASPFCLVATSGADGSCDVSPKGDPPGFTLVLDDRTIALPERAGNRRADGYRNVLANPHVGLLFAIPGRGDRRTPSSSPLARSGRASGRGRRRAQQRGHVR